MRMKLRVLLLCPVMGTLTSITVSAGMLVVNMAEPPSRVMESAEGPVVPRERARNEILVMVCVVPVMDSSVWMK